MSVHREEHLGLCTGAVLDNFDDAGRLELERHLAEGCPECEAELRRLADGATLLAAAAPPVTPPPALKARVLELVRTERRGRAADAPVGGAAPGGDSAARRLIGIPASKRPPMASWMWAAAAAVLAVTSVTVWRGSEHLRGELVAARRQLSAQRQQLTEKDQQLAEQQRWSALLEGTGARLVDLKLTPQGNAVLRARAIYDPQARRAMILFSNFTPPTGFDYQLWALHGGQPASLGLIRADASGRAIVKLPDTGDPEGLSAFAVSLEKAGGSSSPVAPEGPVVMVGKLAGS